MLTFIQFPIADLRYFLDPGQESRLTRPGWPPTVGMGIPRPFVRSFGGAQKRRRGPDSAWLDEVAFCSAHRAIRWINEGPGDQFRVVFRRLFSDGRVVARVEVAASYAGFPEHFRYREWDYQTEELIEFQRTPLKACRDFLTKPTIVIEKNEASSRPLGLQGRALASLYAYATTGSNNTRREELVKPGVPLVLVECTEKFFRRLPQSFQRVNPVSVNGASLAYGQLQIFGGECGVWFLNCASCSYQEMRSVRLCLARLNAEREGLRQTLEALENESLTFDPSSDSGGRLERYLNNTIRLVSTNSWSGVEQSAIREVIELAERSSGPEISLLKQRLFGARRQVAAKVEQYRERLTLTSTSVLIQNVGEFIVESKTINNTISGSTINAPVAMAESIENSFNGIAQSSVDDNIKHLLDVLLTQIAEVGKDFGEHAATVAEDASTLAREVTSEKPRKKWYELSIESLKEAAEAVGEVGQPILKTLTALLPALSAIFP